MHRCLRLTEILEIIFCLVLDVQFIDPSFNDYQLLQPAILPFPNTEGRRSVLNLALTCRAFRDPALNVLHSYREEIWPLRKSVPGQLPKPSWLHIPEQFRPSILRATCVQIFFNQNLHRHDSAYALLLASASKDAPLFPQLRSLGWFDPRVETIPALNLLLPTVHTLALNITDDQFRKAVFQNLRTNSLHLKALEFIAMFQTGLVISELKSFLSSYSESLTELSIRFFRKDIPNVLLEAIAVWPRLQYLTLHIGFNSIPLHAPQPFQALTHLHMSCDNLNLFSSLLHSIFGTDSSTSGCPNLKKIYNIARRCGPTSNWSELLTTLTRTKLEHILILEKCNYELKPCYRGPTLFELRPFLARLTTLVNIKTLLIFPAHDGSIVLTDTDVRTLARACPHLYSVSLGNHNTPVSLDALGYIVRRCCELCEISLRVDARLDALSTIPLDDDEQMYLQPNRRLMRLAIGGSPIACVGPLDPPTAPDLMMSIPRFLHMIAPRLAKLEISLERHFEWTRRRYKDMEKRDDMKRWRKVEEVLLELTQGDTD
ncbi:uncharacterized protein F5147DRAFT_97445 [Suillus discolor]|uniref:F-box domain-containing protein n=1 Tax=Suillus discolor TaxID=1912936 RepID=A0A9P7EQU6_9AGAM|nr:uncharacterized protein F5147DRAFT_97445 [Suillus discolor]KAG2085400.1 hypothetical protein F5147DRAFT_97445 [Suillus discolor]